jgi:hypothetical protein
MEYFEMAKTYISSTWKRIIENNDKLSDKNDGFAKHLREIARPIQIAYQRLMAFSNGNPIGVECKSPDSNRWGFILPEVSSNEYTFRVQNFDEHGFSGHMCYESLDKAINALISDGYRVIDSGALDRTSTTKEWSMGVKRSEIRTRYNRGLISYSELIEQFNLVTD